MTTSSVLDLDADALVIGVATGKDGPIPLGGTEELDMALGGRLATVLADLGATGKAGDLVRFATLGTLRIPTVLAVGVGAPPAQPPAAGTSPADTGADEGTGAAADAAAADGGIGHETLR
ncbi:M17 family peptidase N-terminal domain-containing protein, partial [Frankia sp. CiP1_Cm_nod1]|uniref:M17 family peptidase N-terminal domain-containing protein n=1 Tax=Frankia sp. CiP1_Cm_nod1 TaxID=2897160 RepID=UPI00404514B3